MKLVEAGQAGTIDRIYRLLSIGALEAKFDTTGESMNRYTVPSYS